MLCVSESSQGPRGAAACAACEHPLSQDALLDAQALLAQGEALAVADQALRLIQANYRAGLATYLDVLNADAQYHQANIAEIQASEKY
jgi:outer membrane protein TolC